MTGFARKVGRRPAIAALMAVFALCASLGLQAQSQGALKVNYVEGKVELKTAAAWRAIGIGDQLAADATIRLADKARLELQWAKGKFTLTQSGTYQLKDLVASAQKLNSSGAVAALAGKLSSLMGGNAAANQAAVMGVRGADQSSKDPGYIDSEADVPFQEGKALIAAAKYSDAVARLEMARDYAMPEQLPQILFTLGYAQVLVGDQRAALESLDGLDPKGASWASDYWMLEANLLIDSFAWDRAIALLQGDGAILMQDSNRAPGAWFLLGLAYQGKGDVTNARQQLAKVVSAEPGSDLGKAAAALLAGM